jgi:general secretion pathway protein H
VGSLSTLTLKNGQSGRPHAAAHGFTLLELLVVLVIVGLTMGFVTVNMMQSERQALQNDAQRIALLLQLARDEAIVRNRPIAFEADGERYRFLVRDGANWAALPQEELLREREFKRTPVTLSIAPANVAEINPLRIVFGREPVDKPFVLTLAAGESSVAIRADGIGHFVVE